MQGTGSDRGQTPGAGAVLQERGLPRYRAGARAVAFPPSRSATPELQKNSDCPTRATPLDRVAPSYVSDQLEKHDVGSGECCRRICFDLTGSAAHQVLDKWLIEAEPHVC